jgi:hypothetical protein
MLAPRMVKPSWIRRSMIFPVWPLATASGLMIVNVRSMVSSVVRRFGAGSYMMLADSSPGSAGNTALAAGMGLRRSETTGRRW